MKRTFIGVIIIIFSLTLASLAQEKGATRVPCGENGTQAEANACSRLEYQQADDEMKEVYERLLTELSSYKSNDREKLRRAQALWQQYRDANCESEASIYLGGSIRPAVYNSCLASVTRERTRRLAEFLVVTRQ